MQRPTTRDETKQGTVNRDLATSKKGMYVCMYENRTSLTPAVADRGARASLPKLTLPGASDGPAPGVSNVDTLRHIVSGTVLDTMQIQR